MNKTVALITSAIAVLGLATFMIIGKIDLSIFTTSAAAVLGVIYGFYQKYEQSELKSELEQADSVIAGMYVTVSDKEIEVEHLKYQIDKMKEQELKTFKTEVTKIEPIVKPKKVKAPKEPKL